MADKKMSQLAAGGGFLTDMLMMLSAGTNKISPLRNTMGPRFSVAAYGAVGDGTTIDTTAIQSAYTAAKAYIAAGGQAATVFYPDGAYLVDDEILCDEDAIHSEGVPGTANTWTPFGSCLVPAPTFPDGKYVLAFRPGAKTRTLIGNTVFDLGIMKKSGDTLANLVHGILWQVARGRMQNVHVQEVSGRCLGVQGYNGEYKAHDNWFVNSCLRRSRDSHGVEFLGDSADNWLLGMKIEGHESGAGINNPGAHNKCLTCHFTGNLDHVRFTQGSSEVSFVDCTYETHRNRAIDINTTNGAVSSLRIGLCHFDSNEQTADDTYPAIDFRRTSGSSVARAIIGLNNFSSSGTFKPSAHIKLSAAARAVQILANLYSAGVVSVDHPSSATLCTVNGIGRNNGDPRVQGDWLDEGQEGVRILDTANDDWYTYFLNEWRVG